jgi:hypothetical protein
MPTHNANDGANGSKGKLDGTAKNGGREDPNSPNEE